VQNPRIRITKGNVYDAKILSFSKQQLYDIKKVYADKAHDNIRNFNLLNQLDVEPGIQIRNHASPRARKDLR